MDTMAECLVLSWDVENFSCHKMNVNVLYVCVCLVKRFVELQAQRLSSIYSFDESKRKSEHLPARTFRHRISQQLGFNLRAHKT